MDFMFTNEEQSLWHTIWNSRVVNNLNTSSMNGICGLYLPREVESKSAALLYSMDLASRRTEKGSVIVDTKKAQKLYDFIKSNIELPDVKANPETPVLEKCSEVLNTINEVLSDAIEAKKLKQT